MQCVLAIRFRSETIVLLLSLTRIIPVATSSHVTTSRMNTINMRRKIEVHWSLSSLSSRQSRVKSLVLIWILWREYRSIYQQSSLVKESTIKSYFSRQTLENKVRKFARGNMESIRWSHHVNVTEKGGWRRREAPLWLSRMNRIADHVIGLGEEGGWLGDSAPEPCCIAALFWLFVRIFDRPASSRISLELFAQT